MDYCEGGLFRQLENSNQSACVNACDWASDTTSVEVRVHDQIYKQCSDLRCRYTENPIADLVEHKCVQKCGQGEYLLAEALVCQSVCPFKAYMYSDGQNVCVQPGTGPFEEVGKFGTDSYTRLKLGCAELYEPGTGKCTTRSECTGRQLYGLCLNVCPLTHYLLDGECVLVCPGKQFRAIGNENVCQKCEKYTLKRHPTDTVE